MLRGQIFTLNLWPSNGSRTRTCNVWKMSRMMKSTIVRRNVWEINTSLTFSVRAVMLTSLFRQKRFLCEVTSTSTEKLSSPCHNQWFNTVSTNLGTSLRFDHNNEKMCVFSRSPDLFFGKLFDWWAMSLWHLWNVSRTLKEFTLPVIFSSFSQQRNRHR